VRSSFNASFIFVSEFGPCSAMEDEKKLSWWKLEKKTFFCVCVAPGQGILT